MFCYFSILEQMILTVNWLPLALSEWGRDTLQERDEMHGGDRVSIQGDWTAGWPRHP